MVRFQFIVGGGKLVRGRYDDSLSKWYMNTLPFVQPKNALTNIVI